MSEAKQEQFGWVFPSFISDDWVGLTAFFVANDKNIQIHNAYSIECIFETTTFFFQRNRQEKKEKMHRLIRCICHIISCFTLWSTDQTLEFSKLVGFFYPYCVDGDYAIARLPNQNARIYPESQMHAAGCLWSLFLLHSLCAHTHRTTLSARNYGAYVSRFQITTVRSFYVLLHAAYIIISLYIKKKIIFKLILGWDCYVRLFVIITFGVRFLLFVMC